MTSGTSPLPELQKMTWVSRRFYQAKNIIDSIRNIVFIMSFCLDVPLDGLITSIFRKVKPVFTVKDYYCACKITNLFLTLNN